MGTLLQARAEPLVLMKVRAKGDTDQELLPLVCVVTGAGGSLGMRARSEDQPDDFS